MYETFGKFHEILNVRISSDVIEFKKTLLETQL